MKHKIYLRELEPEDFEQFKKFAKDSEVHEYTNFEIFSIASKIGINKFITANKGSSFAICDTESDKLIGDAGFSATDNGNVEIGLTIFDKSFWGKGYGQEVSKKLVKIIRKQKKDSRIILTVNKENIRAIKCYQKVGFEITGTAPDLPNEYLMVLKSSVNSKAKSL